MKALEIEERKRIMALEQDYSKQILEVKQEMCKSGKQFYTGSFLGYQLIVICTTNGMYTHTIIPCLTYINEVTNS